MHSGEVESNLRHLNETFRLSYIDDLIAMKVGGTEKATFAGDSLEFYSREFQRLVEQLEAARAASQLPEEPSCRVAMNDLLIRARLKHIDA